MKPFLQWCWCLLALLVLEGYGNAAGPPQTESRNTAVKSIAFEFRAVPWPRVFAWLTDQTQKPLITNIKPTGTFTFVPPRPGKKYTVPEIIDILNESLIRQQLELVPRERYLVLIEIEEMPDSAWQSWVEAKDLEKHGKMEWLRVTIPLHSLNAAAILPEVKKMLGPRGSGTALANPKYLILQDRGANLRRLCRMLTALDNPRGR